MIESSETPHAHLGSREDRHRWFDIAIAVAVVAVSVGSLYVSLHTGETMERLVEQNSRLVRANSVPLLHFETGNVNDDGKAEINLTVRNAGTGPARIVWFELLQDGKPVHNSKDLMPKRTKLSPYQAEIYTSGIAPSMMPAGERRTLFAWAKPGNSPAAMPAWDHLDKARHGLKVEACYCSLFEECWLTEAVADVPRPVATCEIGNRTTYQG